MGTQHGPIGSAGGDEVAADYVFSFRTGVVRLGNGAAALSKRDAHVPGKSGESIRLEADDCFVRAAPVFAGELRGKQRESEANQEHGPKKTHSSSISVHSGHL